MCSYLCIFSSLFPLGDHNLDKLFTYFISKPFISLYFPQILWTCKLGSTWEVVWSCYIPFPSVEHTQAVVCTVIVSLYDCFCPGNNAVKAFGRIFCISVFRITCYFSLFNADLSWVRISVVGACLGSILSPWLCSGLSRPHVVQYVSQKSPSVCSSCSPASRSQGGGHHRSVGDTYCWRQPVS